jgi:propanediol dehydratase small subunit
MERDHILTQSGRSLDELGMEAICAGHLAAEDFRISGETLMCQAGLAESAGYRQFAENLRRGAELTRVPTTEVLEIYDALRPGRATYDELLVLARRLETEFNAPRNAALLREAVEVYRVHGLLRG